MRSRHNTAPVPTIKTESAFSTMELAILLVVLATVSADIAPFPLPPSQNIASSGVENLNIGNFYNRNSFAKDESKVRHLSTTHSNAAEGTKDIATAISEPVALKAIEPIQPYYSFPVEKVYPSEISYPRFASPLEYKFPERNDFYPSSYISPYYSPAVEYPYSFPAEYQYGVPYVSAPVYQPVEYVAQPVVEEFYPEFPVRSHFSANNNFKGVSAAATPVSSASEIVKDNTSYSKDVLPVVNPIPV
ncbi:uncharacterized protein [Periplaneta americana]|uniref:uncharacterized protein n=1 Tax=Periplaneta americana TaxID=6978 RepID=UPI0037E74B95